MNIPTYKPKFKLGDWIADGHVFDHNIPVYWEIIKIDNELETYTLKKSTNSTDITYPCVTLDDMCKKVDKLFFELYGSVVPYAK